MLAHRIAYEASMPKCMHSGWRKNLLQQQKVKSGSSLPTNATICSLNIVTKDHVTTMNITTSPCRYRKAITARCICQVQRCVSCHLLRYRSLGNPQAFPNCILPAQASPSSNQNMISGMSHMMQTEVSIRCQHTGQHMRLQCQSVCIQGGEKTCFSSRK